MEDGEKSEVVAQLYRLNTNAEKQLSKWRTFVMGVIYGIGFAIGTTVFAVILLKMLGIIFEDIPYFDAIVRMVRVGI